MISAIIVLGIAWYGLSPLLRNKEVNDALPVTQRSESELAEMAVQMEEAMPEEAEVSEPVPVVDTAIHPASGTVRVVKDGGRTYIRYENYKTINGPDLYVWLANDLEGKDYVDLGPLKGTEGNINYEVPEGVNLGDYRYVLTWCKQFSTLFNSADLSTIR